MAFIFVIIKAAALVIFDVNLTKLSMKQRD